MKKKVLSIILALVMVAGIVPFGAITAFAEGKGSINITDGCDVGKLYGTYFTGDYDDSVFKITGTPTSAVNFNNITFENITCDENGACVYMDADTETKNTFLKFTNCRFINCSTTKDGGVVYINDDKADVVEFVNCSFINCHADGDGGAIYINGTKAKAHGNGNTVISGCSAGDDGGGIYMNYGRKLDGFLLADNTATGDGGGICNTANGATISDCRLYRNTCGSNGGGLYTDNATVNNCKFFENDCSGDGYEFYTNSGSTPINNCTFTSKYSGDNVVYGGMQSNCTFPDKSSYQLTVGDGSQGNPYVIKSTDDWDALHYMALKRERVIYSDGTEKVFNDDYCLYGKYFRLDANIAVCNTVGEVHDYAPLGGAVLYTSYSEFNGNFDGNGHTVTYVSVTGSDRNGVFGYADSATVKNLTVNGYIKGKSRVGGIFGSTYNCTAENCTNNATVYGTISSLGDTASCIGGIVGHSECSNYIGCINNGKVEGMHEHIGGIVGYSNGDTVNGCTNNGNVVCFQKCGGIVGTAHETDSLINGEHKTSKIINCINHASVTAYGNYAGGLIGYEEGAVAVENCIVTGKASSIFGDTHFVNGDYIICSAQNGNICLNINDGSQSSYADLELRDKSTASANVFTLTYNAGTDDYTIKAKHSGLYLAPYYTMAYNPDEWYVVEQMESYTDSNQFRWEFENAGNGYVYIRSQYDNTQGWYLSALNSGAGNGTLIGVSKYKANALLLKIADLKGDMPRQFGADAITGYSQTGSSYEQCFYNKEKTVGSSLGTGLSNDAMNGLTADENGNLMPYCVNDNLKDGWLRAAFDENGSLRFISDAAAMYMGADGLYHYVENATQVTDSMETLGEKGKSTAYYVDGTVTRNGRIQILGNVTLVLNDDCYYDVQGGIGLEKGNSLTVCSYSLGEHMGSMTAAANEENKGAAAIGGNAAKTAESLSEGTLSVSSEKHDCGNLTVYGGKIEAIAYSDGVGIGGNSLSMWHSYINGGVNKSIDFKTGEETFNGGDGGNVKVYNGNLSVKATGAVGIGGGKGAYFYVKVNESVKTDKNFNGGCGGTFAYYGGTVTVESDLAAFGKGRNGDGNRDAVTDPNMTAFTFTEDGVYGALAGDKLSELKKAYNFDDEAFHLNGEKCVQFGKYGYSYTEALNPTCETAGHKAYVLRTADNLYYEDACFMKPIGDTSALQAWISEGGDGYFAPLGHIWVCDNNEQHKCIRCEKTEPHSGTAEECDICRNGIYYNYSTATHTFEKKAIPGGTKILSDFDGNYTLTGGWYLLRGDITAAERITCTGDVHLILENGCNFIAINGIALNESVSLSVYAQSFDAEEMGKLTVPYSPQVCAGIGSNRYVTCGNISIHGGVITATGGYYAAGIGSGFEGSCGNISVYDGNITATGGDSAAGIGTGRFGSCSNISICGGDITAQGNTYAAGIGSGYNGSCESVATSDYLDITAGADKDSAQPVAAYNGEKYVRLTEPSGAAKAPTCTENGHIEFYINEGKYYSDKACTKEITDLSLWLKTPAENGGGMLHATGHDCEYTGCYDDASGDYIITEKCKNCDYTDSYPFVPYDYIAAEKGAYIDTGIKPTDKTRVVMNVFVNGDYEYWFGVWDTDYNKSAFALGNDGRGIYAGYGNQGGTNSNGPLSNGYHTVEMNKNEVYFDGVHYTGIAHTYSSEGFPIQNTLYLFAQNRKGTAIVLNDQSTIHCYGCEIYEDGTLVRKFVPFGNNEGVAGFMDVVNGVFYGNSGNAQMTALNDTHTIIEQINPRCTNIGRSAYYITRLGIFADENHTKKITDLESWRNTPVAEGGGLIPALGHTWEYLDTQKHKCSVCQLEEAHSHNGLGNCAECGAKLYTVTLVNTETSETVYAEITDCTDGCIIESIANGTYIMTVSCEGMVTRTYPIEVTDGRVDETVSLSIEGDVNGDGEITVEDYSAAVNAALASDSAVPEDLTATADYQKAVADLDKDGFVDVLDLVLLERKIY